MWGVGLLPAYLRVAPMSSNLTSKGSTRAWRVIRNRVLIRDGYECAYCGQHATTVDHIVPRVQGGTDDDDNLVAACALCNALKSDRAAFLALRTPLTPYLSSLSPTTRVEPSSPFAKPETPA